MSERKMRRILFLCLWVLSLWAISFFGGAVSYGFFFGMTILPFLSLLYILCVYFRFKIYQELGNRSMVCEEPTDYFFVLENEDYFAFTGVSVRLFSDFSYVEELPGDMEYELLPGDRFTYETRLVCKYRGEYEVGIREVVVTDFLGLFRIRYENPGKIKALVSPRLVRLEELKGAEEFQVPRQRETFGDAEPDIPVRNYREGDSLKRVHWKASARQGKLLVRTQISQEKQGVALFCDMTRYGKKPEDYLPLENKMLEALLALGYFFAARDTGFRAWYRQGAPVRQQVRGLKDFEGFYQNIAEVTFGEEEDIGELLDAAEALGELWDNRVLFFVLHRVSDRLFQAVDRLAAGGIAVVIYAVTEEELTEAVRQSGGRCRMIQIPTEAPLEGRL